MFIWTIAQGFKNIFRNKLSSFMSIATMTVSIFLFGLFYITLTNFSITMKRIQKDVCITVFFEEDSSEKDIEAIGELIKKNDNVEKMEYVSSDNALSSFISSYFDEDSEIKEMFKSDNPLEKSSSYTVYFKDSTKQNETVKEISKIAGVRKINEPTKTVKLLNDSSKLIGIASLFIMIVLIGVSIFLIVGVVSQGIIIRRNEIMIMKLCGATESMIRGQFLTEGIIIGLLGSAIPLYLVFFLYKRVIAYLMINYVNISPYIALHPAGSIFKTMMPMIFATGLGIGYVGSRLALIKYLKI